MRTYKLAADAGPGRNGRDPTRAVKEFSSGGETVVLLVPDSCAIDVVQALSRAYGAGRGDTDTERLVWWESRLGQLVAEVIRRPDAEEALRHLTQTPVGGPTCPGGC